MNVPSQGFPAQPYQQPGARPTAPSDQMGGGKSEKQTKKAKTKEKKAVSGRTNMRRTAIIGAIFAVLFVLALLAMLGGNVTTSTYVVRSTQEIPSQQSVTEAMLEAVKVDEDSLEPGTISADSAEKALDIATGAVPVTAENGTLDTSYVIVGQRTNTRVFAGQQLRTAMFSRLIEPISTTQLAPTERALSIAVPAERAAGGVLREGDEVDVIAVLSNDETRVVSQAVEIIGVQSGPSAVQSASQRQASDTDRQTAATDLLPADPIPGIYILRVDALLMAQFADAQANGELHLVYRAPDATDVDVAMVDITGIPTADSTVPEPQN